MFLRVYCVLFVSPHIQSSVHLAIDARNDGQWANGVAEKAGQDEPAVVDACGDMTTIDSEAPARTMMVTAERHRMPIEQLRCPPADLPAGGRAEKSRVKSFDSISPDLSRSIYIFYRPNRRGRERGRLEKVSRKQRR